LINSLDDKIVSSAPTRARQARLWLKLNLRPHPTSGENQLCTNLKCLYFDQLLTPDPEDDRDENGRGGRNKVVVGEKRTYRRLFCRLAVSSPSGPTLVKVFVSVASATVRLACQTDDPSARQRDRALTKPTNDL